MMVETVASWCVGNVRLMEEILHQLIGSLSNYLQGFIHPRWCRISSINSMICKLMLHVTNMPLKTQMTKTH